MIHLLFNQLFGSGRFWLALQPSLVKIICSFVFSRVQLTNPLSSFPSLCHIIPSSGGKQGVWANLWGEHKLNIRVPCITRINMSLYDQGPPPLSKYNGKLFQSNIPNLPRMPNSQTSVQFYILYPSLASSFPTRLKGTSLSASGHGACISCIAELYNFRQIV